MKCLLFLKKYTLRTNGQMDKWTRNEAVIGSLVQKCPLTIYNIIFWKFSGKRRAKHYTTVKKQLINCHGMFITRWQREISWTIS